MTYICATLNFNNNEKNTSDSNPVHLYGRGGAS